MYVGGGVWVCACRCGGGCVYVGGVGWGWAEVWGVLCVGVCVC